MYSTQLLNVLLLALSLLSVASASLIDGNINRDGLVRRQRVTSTLPSTPSTATTPPSATNSARPTESTPDTPTRTSETPTPTTSTTTTRAPTSTPSTTPKPTQATETTSKESSAPTEVFTVTTVITSMNADGSPTTYTSESTSTSAAGLANGSSGNASEMSPQTRNTVIGVVVGVGGAIVLAGIGLLAWRIWGRKKQQDENDGLMAYNTGYQAVEKTDNTGSPSTAGRSPFQSTLESYHAPTQVNTASNF